MWALPERLEYSRLWQAAQAVCTCMAAAEWGLEMIVCYPHTKPDVQGAQEQGVGLPSRMFKDEFA